MKDRELPRFLLFLSCSQLGVIVVKLLPTFALLVFLVSFPSPAAAVSPTAVISQVYGGGQDCEYSR